MITAEQITEALEHLGVRTHDTLFVHSGLKRCLTVAGRSREEKLATIVRGLGDAVPDGRLILPTFTYSFCDGGAFDIERSSSTVGALTEHFRRLPGVRRTADPIFSAAVLGPLPPEWERRLYSVHDTDCFGEESVFAYLLESRAKLLFFGVGFEFCTFVFHVEQRLGVPYRYFKEFSGDVGTGSWALPVTARYYVRDLDGDVENDLEPLAHALLEEGLASTVSLLPRGPTLFLTDAPSVARIAAERVPANPDFLLRRGRDGQEVGRAAATRLSRST
jgi:aminoglycoside 3-N-acetyltransferase